MQCLRGGARPLLSPHIPHSLGEGEGEEDEWSLHCEHNGVYVGEGPGFKIAKDEDGKP